VLFNGTEDVTNVRTCVQRSNEALHARLVRGVIFFQTLTQTKKSQFTSLQVLKKPATSIASSFRYCAMPLDAICKHFLENEFCSINIKIYPVCGLMLSLRLN
jgi:hypothetical protein